MRLAAGRVRATRVGAILPLGLLVLVLAALLPAGAAHAAEYRYWSYWHGTSASWTYGTSGPASYPVSDGDVEGWRLSVSRDGQSPPPRAAAGSATFAKICGSRTAGQGQARVAVVLDFGVTADARPGDTTPSPAVQGRCAVIDSGSTGAQALSAVASLRVEKGLVCGVDGYPSRGCGEAAAPAPAPTTTKPAPRPSATGSAAPAPTRRSASGPGAAAAPASTSTAGSNAVTATPPAASGATATTTPATTATTGTATSASPTSRRTPAASTTSAATAGSDPTPTLAVTAADRGGSGGSWTGLAVAGVIVLALAGGALVTARRRRP